MSSGQQGGQTVQTQTSTNESGPPQAIEGSLKTASQDLWNYYLQHPNAPAYYPGSTVAQFSPQSQQAINALYARGQNGSPLESAANQNALGVLNGNYLDISNNPYFQKAIAAGTQPVIDQFNSQVLPGVAGQFEGAGRYGSGQQMDATRMATDSLTRSLTQAGDQAAWQAYQGERQNQMSALGMLPSFQAADYQNLAAMLQAGGMIDSKAQQNIDADVARYNYEQNAQPNWITNIAQQLQSIYPGGRTTGSGTTSGYSSSYSTPSVLDTLMNGANLGLKAYSTFRPSDERVKVGIRPVGKLHDGQTVYSYRYQGDPRTEIGLLAQEVERRHPEAVALHPSGMKMVDYRRATRSAGAGQAACAAPGLPRVQPRGGLM